MLRQKYVPAEKKGKTAKIYFRQYNQKGLLMHLCYYILCMEVKMNVYFDIFMENKSNRSLLRTKPTKRTAYGYQ